MTVMQEKAFEIIRQLPDDKVYYILQLLDGLEGLTSQAMDGGKTLEQKAYEDLQQFRKCRNVDIDYKEELMQAKEKKYASVD